jgi:hypothetical protein
MINKTTVDAVIAILNSNYVDGETMEYIIEQTGMTKPKPEPKPESKIISSFLREQLIDLVVAIKSQVFDSVTDAIDEIDINEDVVEVELNYNRQLEITLNNDVIRDVYKEEVCGVINLDRAVIEIEIESILSKM